MAWTDNLWAGFGFEVGGEIGVGLSKQTGILISIEDLAKPPRKVRYLGFQQVAVTFGVGLGGAFGTNFVIGVNAPLPMDFDGVNNKSGEWDFSLDMGLGGLDKYIRSAPEMIELLAISKKFDRNLFSVANNLKKYEANAYHIKDAAEGVLKNGNALFEAVEEKAAIISLPLGGLGLRASLKRKFETTDVVSTPFGVL